VGIAHPLELGEAAVAAWTARLAADGVVAPFPQLERVVTSVDAADAAAESWCGLVGVSAATSRIKGAAERNGWRRGDTSHGMIQEYYKSFALADVVARIGMTDMPVV